MPGINELADLLETTLFTTVFKTKGGKEVPQEQLQRAFSNEDGRTLGVRDILGANPVIPRDRIDRLAGHLRVLLSDHVNEYTDQIGHSFNIPGDQEAFANTTGDFAFEVEASSSILTFTKAAVRAAGCLGSRRAAQLIHEWKDGEPRAFKVSTVLSGVHVDEPIDLGPGITLQRLPLSSEFLPNAMPSSDTDTEASILGRTELIVWGQTAPALFRPPAEENGMWPNLRSSVAFGRAQLEDLMTALSLTCNQRVSKSLSWHDPCESGAFTGVSSSLGFRGSASQSRWDSLGDIGSAPTKGVVQLLPRAPLTPNLFPDDAQKAHGLLPELIRLKDENERFRVAMTRWMSAMSHEVQSVDRLIDLRIALEALYIDSNQGELGFRMALTGARHLGVDLNDRKNIQRSLREFYGVSSEAIHATAGKQFKNSQLETIEQATKLCRDGILKIIETRNRPNWNDFLLS